MALPTGTTLPPTPMLGGDDEYRQKYLTAINDVVSSLEKRNQPNWFSVAGQLLDPGKTGNVGEAIGRSATELGRQQEQQEQQAPSIAMMRAQLAGQEYELGNQAKALRMLGNIFGTDPKTAANMVSTGNLPTDAFSKITPENYMALSVLSPKLAESMKNAYSMDVERAKLVQGDLERGVKVADIIGKYGEGALKYVPKGAYTVPGQEPAPAPTTSNLTPMLAPGLTLSSGFGQRPDPFNKDKMEMHSHLDFGGKLGTPINSLINGTVVKAGEVPGFGNYVEVKNDQGLSTFYGHLKDINVKEGSKIEAGTPVGTLGSTGKSTGPHLAFGMKDAKGNPLDPTPYFKEPVTQVASTGNIGFGSDVPLAARSEITKERINAEDKLYNDPKIGKIPALVAMDPQFTGEAKNQLRELDSIINKDVNYVKEGKRQKSIFGLLQEQGWLNAAASAVKEGVQAGGTQISIPAVDKFVEMKDLSKTDRQDLRRASQILASQFLANVQKMGKLLGTNPTDNDARLYQAPMGSIADTAASLKYWTQHQFLNMDTAEKMYKGYSDYTNKLPEGSKPSLFWTRTDSPYQSILQNYNSYYNQLTKRYSPGAQ